MRRRGRPGRSRSPRFALLAASLVLAGASGLRGQDAEPAPPSLEETERAVAAEFAQLEQTLMKMARYLRKTEPERADLLVRALERSRQERIEVRLGAVADLLRSDAAAGLAPNFGDAIEQQAELIEGMRGVLGLLRSEDRRDEIDSEQERLQALLKDVGRLLGDQKAAEAANRRGETTERVAGKQGDVTDRTGKLLDRIAEDDARTADADAEARDAAQPTDADDSEPADGDPGGDGDETEPGENADGERGDGEKSDGEKSGAESGEPKAGEPENGEPSEGEPGDGDPSEGESGEGEPKSGEPSEGEPQSSEPGESGEPQEGQPSEGQPSQGQPSQSQSPQGQPQQGQPQQGEQGEPGESGEPQEPQTPGAQQLQEAKRAMEEAQKELEEAEREGAREKQAEAIRKLTEAREKLEEILRQLREEEAELVLRALEVRFQKMLEDQQAVLAGTVALQDKRDGDWTEGQFGRLRDLARREKAIGLEGEKALELLRQDGSSVAFPEALEQILADVAFAADLLGTKQRAGELTQQVERDVIASLEEVIAAFQQELEKMQERKQSGQSPPQGGGEPGEEGLVDKIAELKMLRTLQVGVNRRTLLLGGETGGAGAGADAGAADGTDVDVAARLRDLAGRQRRIESATYDLAVGKNR